MEKLESKLKLVKIRGSLKDIKKVHDSFDAIINYLITTFKNYKELKNDVSFLNVICNSVETLVIPNNKSKKINKKEFVIKILNHLFQLNDGDEIIFSKQIDYLFDEKKIVKYSKSFFSFSKDIFSFGIKFFC